MAYYFYRVSLKELFGSEYNIERLYNVEIDGLHYGEPEMYHKNGLYDYTVVARNKQEALDITTKYIYKEELESEIDDNLDECDVLSAIFEDDEFLHYFDETYPDDLPYGGYPSKLNI